MRTPDHKVWVIMHCEQHLAPQTVLSSDFRVCVQKLAPLVKHCLTFKNVHFRTFNTAEEKFVESEAPIPMKIVALLVDGTKTHSPTYHDEVDLGTTGPMLEERELTSLRLEVAATILKPGEQQPRGPWEQPARQFVQAAIPEMPDTYRIACGEVATPGFVRFDIFTDELTIELIQCTMRQREDFGTGTFAFKTSNLGAEARCARTYVVTPSRDASERKGRQMAGSMLRMLGWKISGMLCSANAVQVELHSEVDDEEERRIAKRLFKEGKFLLKRAWGNALVKYSEWDTRSEPLRPPDKPPDDTPGTVALVYTANAVPEASVRMAACLFGRFRSCRPLARVDPYSVLHAIWAVDYETEEQATLARGTVLRHAAGELCFKTKAPQTLSLPERLEQAEQRFHASAVREEERQRQAAYEEEHKRRVTTALEAARTRERAGREAHYRAVAQAMTSPTQVHPPAR